MGFVRVKGPDGAEFTVDEAAAAHYGSDYKVTDKPAVDANNRPLPWKPATTLDGRPKTAADNKPKEG